MSSRRAPARPKGGGIGDLGQALERTGAAVLCHPHGEGAPTRAQKVALRKRGELPKRCGGRTGRCEQGEQGHFFGHAWVTTATHTSALLPRTSATVSSRHAQPMPPTDMMSSGRRPSRSMKKDETSTMSTLPTFIETEMSVITWGGGGWGLGLRVRVEVKGLGFRRV